MKICLLAETYPPYEGGSETFLYDLIEILRKKHEIILITRYHPAAKSYEKKDNLSIYRVFNFPLPRIHKYFFMNIVSFLKASKVAINCDIISVQNLSPCFAGHMLKKHFKIPYVQILEAIPSSFAGGVANFIYKYYLRMCDFDKLIVWSEELKNTVESWGMDAITIEGGINTINFSPKISGSDIRKKYGYPLIVTAKPLYKNNALGLSFLIQAMKSVNAKLIIIGDGKYRCWLEELVKNLKLKDKVLFTGNILHDKIPSYYAAADIISNSIIFDVGIRPSVSLLESMAMRKPTLLTKNFESGEINKKNLCLAKIKDSNDISKKLNLLLKDKKYANMIANNARKLVEKKYSMEIVAKKITKIYETLI